MGSSRNERQEDTVQGSSEEGQGQGSGLESMRPGIWLEVRQGGRGGPGSPHCMLLKGLSVILLALAVTEHPGGRTDKDREVSRGGHEEWISFSRARVQCVQGRLGRQLAHGLQSALEE